MKRTILLIAMLAMAGVAVRGQNICAGSIETCAKLAEQQKFTTNWIKIPWARATNPDQDIQLGLRSDGLVAWRLSLDPLKHAHAQQEPGPITGVKPAPAPEVEIVAAPAESATEIRTALQDQETARLAYENAQTRTANTFLRAIGEASIKPHECERQTPQGINPFGCIKIDRQTGAVSFEKPKAKK